MNKDGLKKIGHLLLPEEIKEIKNLILDEVNIVMEDGEYLKNLKLGVYRYARDEIKIKLSDNGLRDIIRSLVKDVFREESKDIIKEVIRETINTVHKRLRVQEKIARELSLSIDSEIKGIARSPELCAETQQAVKKVMETAILNNNNFKQIESDKDFMEQIAYDNFG